MGFWSPEKLPKSFSECFTGMTLSHYSNSTSMWQPRHDGKTTPAHLLRITVRLYTSDAIFHKCLFSEDPVLSSSSRLSAELKIPVSHVLSMWQPKSTDFSSCKHGLKNTACLLPSEICQTLLSFFLHQLYKVDTNKQVTGYERAYATRKTKESRTLCIIKTP